MSGIPSNSRYSDERSEELDSIDDMYDAVLAACSKVRGDSCQCCKELSALQLQIKEAQNSLEELLSRRKDLNADLNEAHDALVNHLPTEIISDIFVYCQPYPPSLDVFNKNFDEETLLKSKLFFGQVSKRWREIAMHTPELWTVLLLSASSSPAWTLDIIQSWLESSGGLPLYLKYACSSEDGETIDFACRLATMIIRHAGRWKVFDISAPYTILSFFSSKLSNIPQTQLDHLMVGANDISYDSSDCLRLNAAPQRLTVGHIYLKQTSFIWDRLTHVETPNSCSLTRGECIQLFQSASHLLSCTISFTEDNYATPSSVIIAPSLRYLHIDSHSSQFWTVFSFPSLETLLLFDSLDSQWTNVSPIAKIFRESGHIQSLTIKDCIQDKIECGGMVELLGYVPRLARLSLNGNLLQDDHILAALLQNLNTRVGFLANVNYLKFETDSLDVKWKELFQIMNLMKGRTLKELEIRLVADLDDEDEDDVLGDIDIVGAMQGLQFRMVDGSGKNLVDNIGC